MSDSKRYRENRQGEVDGAALYRTLAEPEKKPQLAEVTFPVGHLLGVAVSG